MKKVLIVALFLLCFISFVGCQKLQSKITEDEKTVLEYTKLSDENEVISMLTGNKISLYKLNNLPKDKKYNFYLTYEVYNKGIKTKEDKFFDIRKDDTSGDVKGDTLGINFQGNKLQSILGGKGTYLTNDYDMQEDISKYFSAKFTGKADLPIGTEMYIFYATSNSSISADLPLGVSINEEITKKIVANDDSVILIKLSLKEI